MTAGPEGGEVHLAAEHGIASSKGRIYLTQPKSTPGAVEFGIGRRKKRGLSLYSIFFLPLFLFKEILTDSAVFFFKKHL